MGDLERIWIVTVLVSILILGIFSTDQQAFGDVFQCSSTLDESNVVPPSGSTGTGTMTGTFDDNTGLLSWNISYGGLSSPETAMHFHGPATAVQNAGVQVGVGAVGSPTIGNALLTGVQETNLLNGLWYINLHSSNNPGGAIRGQVNCELVDDIVVGGTFVPIDQSALLLAGVQSISMWMIPVVVAGIGIGVFVIKRRN